nr:nucleotide exchange factor GrpE [Ktedonobacterales bacterium]
MSNPQDIQATENGAGVADLQAQLEQTRAELAEAKDKYLRTVAEMDNFRKQMEKRMADRVRLDKRNVMLRVIEVVDDLERALAYVDVADKDTLAGALRHMHNQINTMLQREGVTSFTSSGESFDPRVHEAVESVDNSGQPEGQIVQEMQKGYKFNDELLR